MPRWIEARRVDGELRFREWSSIVDKYVTAPMTREAMAAHLLWDYTARETASGFAAEDIAARLDRAGTRGSSALGTPPSELDEPWNTERCDGCGGFHHAFDPWPDGICGECGEPESDRSHREPCAATPAPSGAA